MTAPTRAMRRQLFDDVSAAVEAGVDNILLKDESSLRGEAYNGLLSAVRSGRITEKRLDESVTRLLLMKERFGLIGGRKD